MRRHYARAAFWTVLLFPTASISHAAAIYRLTVTPNPNPVFVIEGSPGAINWTVKNNSSSDNQTDNLSVTINYVTMAVRPLVFLSGDPEDEAFNPAITNPAQYVGLVVPPQGTFVFTQTFQSRDLGTSVEPDEGIWHNRVFVSFQHPGGPSDGEFGDAEIHVRDPGFVPEPAMLTCLAGVLTVGSSRRRG